MLRDGARPFLRSFVEDGTGRLWAGQTRRRVAQDRADESGDWVALDRGLGFVEEVPSADKRERRWQLAIQAHGIPKSAQDSTEVLEASRLWGQQWVAIEQRILAQFLANEAQEPKVWRKAATFSSSEVHLTPDEVIELGEKVSALLKPYVERDDDSAARPRRSRPVRVVLTAFPRPADPGQRRNTALPPRVQGDR